MGWNLENGWVLSHATGRRRRNACECEDCNGTGQVESCTEHEDCDGRVACQTCHVDEYVPCPDCDINNPNPDCPTCNGDGSLPCPDCEGGYVPCEHYGEQECSTCEGTGEDVSESDPDDRD